MTKKLCSFIVLYGIVCIYKHLLEVLVCLLEGEFNMYVYVKSFKENIHFVPYCFYLFSFASSLVIFSVSM